ncbi:MATE family efflux transporter, partial [Pseudomonas frederiksbergensis]|nr:MATE family efflux transporter [Pseudomonas frederiksbergensis]
ILNLALPSLLVTFLNGLLAVYSQSYVTVLGIYYKLQTFLYLPANGIVQGMRPLVGYNYGAREHGRVSRLYNLTLGL